MPSLSEQLANGSAIQINNAQLYTLVDKVRQWLQRHNTPEKAFLFQRDGAPYYLDNQGKPRPLLETTAAEKLSKDLRWVERKGTKFVNVLPCRSTIRAVLENPEGFLDLTGGVVRAPFYSRSGELVHKDGYHAESQCYLKSQLSERQRWQCPTDTPIKQDVDTAVDFLSQEVLGGFRFESEADKTNALGLLLLPYCKPLVRGMSPLHLIEAPTPGTGKSLLSEVIVQAYQGSATDSISYPDDNGIAAMGEFKKECDTALLEARPVVTIENVNGVLQGGFFAKLVSQPRHSIRRFHTQTSADVYNKGIWIANGNNPRVSDEIARRIVKIRLDSKTESPELRRDFDPEKAGVDRMLSWVNKNRPRIVGACLTLIQSWLANGRPLPAESTPSKGGFDSWREVIGGILHNAGLTGFLENQSGVRKDPLYEEWVEFIEAWSAARRVGQKLGKGPDEIDLGRALRPAELNAFAEDHNLLPITRGQDTPQSQTTRLGRMLNKYLGRVFVGWQLKQEIDRRNHSSKYSLEPSTDTPITLAAEVLPAPEQQAITFVPPTAPAPTPESKKVVVITSAVAVKLKERLIEFVARGENFTRSEDAQEFHFEYEDEGSGERIKLTLASKPVEEIQRE